MTDNHFQPQMETPHAANLLEVARRQRNGRHQHDGYLIVAVFLAVALMIVNGISVPVAELVSIDSGPFFLLVPLGFGIYIAQVAILSTFLVFGTAPVWQRLGLHWLIAAALIGLWLVGFEFSDSSPP